MKSIVFTLHCSHEETLTFEELGLTQCATEEEIDSASVARMEMLLEYVEIDTNFVVSDCA